MYSSKCKQSQAIAASLPRFVFIAHDAYVQLYFIRHSLLCFVVTDERFRYLFTKGYQRKQQYFEQSYTLTIETNQTSSYSTRSNLECSTLCRQTNNCTGFNYVHINSTCGIWESVAVVLP